MIIITSEYDYNNIKLNETRNIVENTLLEYEQKYGYDYRKSVEVKCVAEFFDKIKNETKNITIECDKNIGELKKIMQSTKGIIKFTRIIESKIIIKGRIYKNVLDHYLECENIPILWKNFSGTLSTTDRKDIFNIVLKSIFVISMKDNITLSDLSTCMVMMTI